MGAPEKTTPRQDRALLRMVGKDCFISACTLKAWMRNLYGMMCGRIAVNNQFMSHGYSAYGPTRKLLLTANPRHVRLEWAQKWQRPTMAHWQHVIFGDESRFQLYLVDGRLRVHCLPGERFQQRCQADRVQAIGGSVHVRGAFHSGAKSLLLLPDRYLISDMYRDILQITLVPFARQHFGDNYRYLDNNAMPHHARVVLDFLQQGNITKMGQPERSPDYNPIEHNRDELGRGITSMDNLRQNLCELRQALLDKSAEISVENLQCLVTSMPQRLPAIIAAGSWNTQYWPSIHEATPTTGSIIKKEIMFVWPDFPQLPSNDI